MAPIKTPDDSSQLKLIKFTCLGISALYVALEKKMIWPVLRLSEIIKYCMVSGKCHFYQLKIFPNYHFLTYWSKLFHVRKIPTKILLELLQNINSWQLNLPRVMFFFKAKKWKNYFPYLNENFGHYENQFFLNITKNKNQFH